MRCSYPYTARPNGEGRIEIAFPQFPGEVSILEPETDNETVHKTAMQTLIGIMEAKMAKREPIPGGENLESKTGAAFVFVSWITLAKLILYNEFREAGISYNAFANKIGISQTRFARLLNLRHESREKAIFGALDALGIETEWDFNLVPIERSYPT